MLASVNRSRSIVVVIRIIVGVPNDDLFASALLDNLKGAQDISMRDSLVMRADFPMMVDPEARGG